MAQILFKFYAFPVALLQPEMVQALSKESMILYMLMLDRQRQSGGETITFTRREVMDVLQVSHFKAKRIFQELQAAGLIDREEHRGASAALIRVFLPRNGQKNDPLMGRNSSYDGQKNDPLMGRNSSHDGQKNDPLMGRNSSLNGQIHLNQKDREFNREDNREIYPNYYQSISPSGTETESGTTDGWKKMFHSQLEMERLSRENPQDAEQVASVVNLLADVCANGGETVKIGHVKRLVAEVRERFQSLTVNMVLSALESVTQAQAMREIKNPRAYLLAALYNAPADATIGFRNKSADEIWGIVTNEEAMEYARKHMGELPSLSEEEQAMSGEEFTAWMREKYPQKTKGEV